MSRTRQPFSLSRLGLGGAQLGNLYREVSDATAAQTFAAAWEAGIRYFDTAVVSVVVGAGTPSQVADAVQRLAQHIPEVVWSELAADGLIRDPQRQRDDR